MMFGDCSDIKGMQMAKRKPRRKGASRRAYLKSYSMRGGGKPDMRLMQEAQARVASYQYGEHIPPTETTIDQYYSANNIRSETLVLPPAIEVANKLAEIHELAKNWQSLRFQNLHLYHHIVVVSVPGDRCLKLFFHGREWFFVRENFKTGFASRSMAYDTKADAMRRFNNDSITWLEFKPLHLLSTERKS